MIWLPLVYLFASAAALKVQLSPSNLTPHLQDGFQIWQVTSEAASHNTTLDGVTLSLAALGDTLKGGRYKVISEWATSYLGEWVVGFGVSTTTATANIPLELSVTGLSAGSHTLLAYHNGYDALTTTSTLEVTINGVSALPSVAQTFRKDSIWNSGTSYITFNVTSTSETTKIVYTPTGSGADKRAYINGLEFDVPNIATQPSFPLPSNLDEHVDADSYSIPLAWRPAPAASSYRIFVSTTSAAAAASQTAVTGTSTVTNFALTGIDPFKTYWWRVDTVLTDNTIVAGRVWTFRPRTLAFSGADGFGKYARGGRGGKVLRVTTLDDTGTSGSLRWAIESNTGPRIIVFDVGGVSTLKSRLVINSPYVTIAGQTAPGKGIIFQGYPLGLSGARDAVIRHVRVRPGKISGETIDGMGMRGSNFAIFDRCSISWTIDESFSSRDAYNITLQRTLISEPLNSAGHKNYPAGTEHGYAASIGGNTGTFHHNLIAHAQGRSWSMAGGAANDGSFTGGLSIVNNVVYNFGNRVTDGGAHQVDFINNYYKQGPASSLKYALRANYEDGLPGTQQYYCAGNMMPGVFTASSTQVVQAGQAGACYADVTVSPAPTYPYFLASPFFPDTVTIQTAAEAYKRVLSDVGANVPLDTHDVRVIAETLAGTAAYKGSVTGKPGLIDDPADCGGLESWPTTTKPAWDVDSDGDGVPNWWDGSTGGVAGWDALDGYLNFMADPHTFVAPSGEAIISLADLAAGFQTPTFTATVDKGTVSVSSGTATYTAPSSAGIAKITVQISDSEGSTWTRTYGVGIIDGFV